MSRPARGAWVEILSQIEWLVMPESRPARGAWVEIDWSDAQKLQLKSRPARGAWVEMGIRDTWIFSPFVAPRKGRVG